MFKDIFFFQFSFCNNHGTDILHLFVCFSSLDGTMFDQLNAEQQTAVKQIISKNDKLPYILFGPPGKAFLVLMIMQL